MIHLVNAGDLHDWAARPESKTDLPLLVRRLISVSIKGTTEYNVRAEIGIYYGGWDGIVRKADPLSFQVPAGDSFWEFGCDQNPAKKANEDYEKRTRDPLGVDCAASAFVFVTPRNWPGRDAWITEKKKDGKWKEIIALDADSLRTWMESIPSMHIWATTLLGRSVTGLIGLDQWWQIWSSRTDPAITRGTMLCGRDITQKLIANWLLSEASQVSLISGSVDESLGILAAVIEGLDPQTSDMVFGRALKVAKGTSISSVLAGRVEAILIVEQDDVERIRQEVGSNHRIIALGSHTIEGASIEVEKLDPRKFSKILESGGLVESESAELAGLARRSFQAFRRQRAIHPDGLRPEWAKNVNDAQLILSIILAQRWNGAEGSSDRDEISTMTGQPYSHIEKDLNRLAAMEDPPIRRIVDEWSVVSLLDAWNLTKRHLTTDIMKRFERVALQVLGEDDPGFNIPASERIFAFMRGDARRKYSNPLRKGLADSLAMLAEFGRILPSGCAFEPSALSIRIVAALLDSHAMTEKTWYSLTDILPDLAEANPSAFLSACERDLNSSSPLIFRLYILSAFMQSSPHIHLLWALERLAWKPDHLMRCAVLLSKLTVHEKPSNSGNLASVSLQCIFVGWIRYTAASIQQKLAAIDGVRIQMKEQSWSLMFNLLPSKRKIITSRATPSWAGWAPPSLKSYSKQEYKDYTVGVVNRLLEDSVFNLPRLTKLLEKANRLPSDSSAAIIAHIRAIDPQSLLTNERHEAAEVMRKVVLRHQVSNDVNRSMPEEQIQLLIGLMERFSLDDPIHRNIWLFKNRVEFPVKPEKDSRDPRMEKLVAVENARNAAIQTVIAYGGLDAVRSFATRVELPEAIGSHMAFANLWTDARQDEVILLLRSNLKTDQAIAKGYVRTRCWRGKNEWLINTMSRMRPDFTDLELAALALESEPAPQVWQLVDSFGAGVASVYWGGVDLYKIPSQHTPIAAKRLIEHGRAFSAVHALGNMVDAKQQMPSGDEALQALRAACASNPQLDPPDNSFDWALGRLLDHAIMNLPDQMDALAQIEWVLLQFLTHDESERGPKVLHLYLNLHPEFFVELVGLVKPRQVV